MTGARTSTDSAGGRRPTMAPTCRISSLSRSVEPFLEAVGLEAPHPARILDVGCGTGKLLRRAAAEVSGRTGAGLTRQSG